MQRDHGDRKWLGGQEGVCAPGKAFSLGGCVLPLKHSSTISHDSQTQGQGDERVCNRPCDTWKTVEKGEGVEGAALAPSHQVAMAGDGDQYFVNRNFNAVQSYSKC